MMTSAKYAVSWCYDEMRQQVRRTLYHSTVTPCVEAARLIANSPYAFDIEVLEVDTGKSINWAAPSIGAVLHQEVAA